MPDGSDYLVVAGNRGASSHPDWFLNLVARPEVRVELGRRRYAARALVLDDAERDRLWPRLREELPPIAAYEQRTTRRIPVVRLVLQR